MPSRIGWAPSRVAGPLAPTRATRYIFLGVCALLLFDKTAAVLPKRPIKRRRCMGSPKSCQHQDYGDRASRVHNEGKVEPQNRTRAPVMITSRGSVASLCVVNVPGAAVGETPPLQVAAVIKSVQRMLLSKWR